MDDEGKFDSQKFAGDLRDKVHRDIEAGGKNRNARRSSGDGLFWGAVLVLVGVAFLLDQMGIFPVQQAFHLWPALLILAGAFSLRPGKNIVWGIILVIAGVLLLTNQFGYTHVRFRDIWPMGLIALGLWIMLNSSRVKVGWIGKSRSEPEMSEDPSSKVNAEAVFGSSERRITSKNFQGGKLAAVFGEVILDLRQADIAGDEAVIHADAVFGSVQIRVPAAWDVVTRGTAVLGSFGDATRSTDVEDTTVSNKKKLIVRGGAVFGEVEIKN